MSWAVAAVGAAAVGASVGGSAITGNSNLNTAARQAKAANDVLAASNVKQDEFQASNTAALNGTVAGYAPDAQSAQLHTAQAKRGGADVAAISAPVTNDIPITGDAPAAVQGEISKRMGAAHNYATGVAQATGNLGGYNDTWQENSLRDADASRNINYTNDLSNEERALLDHRQKLAMAAAYRPPSIWGQILSGIGSVLGSKAGSMAGGASLGGSSDIYAAGQPGAIVPQTNGGIGHA